MVLFEVALLVVFTFILSKMSCIAVEQAGKLSDYFGISKMAIGMLVVGMMVSLPELSVAITSSALGQGELSAGNVFGANSVLILFALGVGAFVYGFRIERKNLEDIAFVLLVTFLISIYLMFLTQMADRPVGFLEGMGLFIIFAWYAAKMVIDKAIIKSSVIEDLAHFNTRSLDFAWLARGGSGPATALVFTGSVLAVYVSANIVVDSAISLTSSLGLEQSFIGATFISLGTSLPEIMVALHAIRKKMYGLALGDVMGSIMVNITLVLGAAAVIQPISLHLNVFGIALLFAVLANFVFFYYAAMRGKFGKREGISLIALYALYLLLITASQLKMF